MGFVDAIGAASIMPFMSLLGNPEIIEKNQFLKSLKEISHINSHEDFTFFIGISVFTTCIFFISENTYHLRAG